MFRLYSTAKRLKIVETRKTEMSEPQERLQKFGSRQIAHLGRLVVIVHNDILKLVAAAKRSFGNLFGFIGESVDRGRSASEALLRAKGFTETPRFKATSLVLDDRRSKTEVRVTQAPEGQCIYAIGDVHGRCDLLTQLLDKIDADRVDLPNDTEIILIFLGDYIDRGLQSRQVIELLMGERLQAYTPIFLMGNHEEALLRFRGEASFGNEWARFGGGETLYSYGVQPPSAAMAKSSETWQSTWSRFNEVFPSQHLDFFQSMKHYVTIGDYFFVHAGLRPNVPIEDQTVDDMLWIRDEFLSADEAFPYLIVHGHTPTQVPFIDNRRMGLDTGAFSSGVLTAAKFFGTDIAVIKTG